MSSISQSLYVDNFIETTGQVKLHVDYVNLANLDKTYVGNKSCSINTIIKNNIDKSTGQNVNEQNINEQIFTETEVILDKTTQSQLTPKFIKSCSNSEWVELIGQVEQLYQYDTVEQFNVELTKQIALKFVNGLEKDFEALKSNLPVSDCGLFAPRPRTTYNNSDRPIRFVNLIVNLLYVEKNRVTKFENGKVMYTKLISKLSKKYVEQYTKEFLSNNKFKLFRLLEHDRKNWCALKNKPVGTVVTEPSAMPVEIAPLEELEPFFKFLDSNAIPTNNDDEFEPCMRFTRGALYQDKRMDLCKQVVGFKWIEMLMSSLVNNTQVEHFLLGNNIIGPVGGKAIGQFLLNSHKPKIKTWYIAGNDLNPEGIRWICQGLESDPDCVNLWLKRNPLKPQGIKHISNMLKTNNRIKILDLHNTAVLDEGVGYLIEGLKENRVLRHLYLDANGITEKGIDYLVEYFEYLVTNDLEGISSFWFDMNNIGDNGIIRLVEVLGRYKHLKRLVLGSTGITEKAVEQIVKSFGFHPNLIVLDLGMYKSTSDMGMITNNIGDEGAKLLSNLIKINNKLQYLSVMMNGMSVIGIEHFGKALETNSTLMYMDWTQYGVEVPQQLNASIKAKLESNRTNAGFTRKLRNLKHGNQIHWIDSIYRNNMK